MPKSRAKASSRSTFKKLRGEGEQGLESLKRFGGRRFQLNRNVNDLGAHPILGQNAGGGTEFDGDLVFHIPGTPSVAVTFLPQFQLLFEARITVKVTEYANKDYLSVKTGTETTEETLVPRKHGLAPSPSNGLYSLYDKTTISYNHGYEEALDNLTCGSANLLAKTGVLEASFNPHWRPGGGGAASDFDPPTYALPAFNRTAEEILQEGAGLVDRVWPTKTTESGYRTYRSRIPKYPFRTLAPWQQARLTESLGGGGGVYPKVGIIPPNVDVRLVLGRDQKVPHIMQLIPLHQKGSQAGDDPAEFSDTVTKAWRQYRTGKEESAYRYFEVESAQIHIRKVYLLCKKIALLMTDPRQTSAWLSAPQVFSCYRTYATQLLKTSVSNYYLSWDVSQAPATIFIGFLRESEVQRGGSGIADTQAKLAKLMSTSSDHWYRPLKLASLRLCDNTGPNADVLVDGFRLDNMGLDAPDPTLPVYAEYLR